jgi:hypothetical protein
MSSVDKKRERDTEHTFPSSTICDIVKDILASTKPATERKAEYAKKYPEFSEQFPVLFASACEPDFDFNRFKYMMRMRDQVLDNSRTHESASTEIGQRLFDHYVKPTLKTPTDPKK